MPILAKDAAPSSSAAPSSFAASTGSATPPFWAKIGDGKLQQVLFKGEFDFVKYPGWFLADGHLLGRSAFTKNLTFLCTPEFGEELVLSRPPVDWCRAQPMLKYLEPFTLKVDATLLQHRSTIVGEDAIQELNQEFIFSGHRRQSGCRIADWSRLSKSPSMFYTDGRGFVLAEYMLRDFYTEMPFHPVEIEILNLLNICPA